ncbi:ribonuclease 2-like isoform X2 [Tasmannia lanceolata]|uniref:ribonuclease 2-like isoform X2 n=1 Tax=Tasmannia lanceolata TaxID=3420 RepID=UPI004063E738
MAASTPRSFFPLFFFSFLYFSFSFSLNVGKEQKEFDYFILALQWPGTICQRTHHCCSSNGCCRSSLSPTEFTMHGLWPNYNDGSWPACCSGSNFDIKKITSLNETLERYWPSLSCTSSSVCHGGKGLFWAHEWEKHGTCSFPVIQDEYSYFSTALDLYFKYNLTNILFNAGYQPTNSNKYPLGAVVTAIERAVGASPSLVCSHGAVEELRLCFYKDFKPRDCESGSNTRDDVLGSSSCPRYISIPEFMPSSGIAAVPWILESAAS